MDLCSLHDTRRPLVPQGEFLQGVGHTPRAFSWHGCVIFLCGVREKFKAHMATPRAHPNPSRVDNAYPPNITLPIDPSFLLDKLAIAWLS